jgi:hypothetical protein
MTKKAKAYIAFVSFFVVFALILWFGSQLHGWTLWLFAIWAGATIGSFLGGDGPSASKLGDHERLENRR